MTVIVICPGVPCRQMYYKLHSSKQTNKQNRDTGQQRSFLCNLTAVNVILKVQRDKNAGEPINR